MKKNLFPLLFCNLFSAIFAMEPGNTCGNNYEVIEDQKSIKHKKQKCKELAIAAVERYQALKHNGENQVQKNTEIPFKIKLEADTKY